MEKLKTFKNLTTDLNKSSIVCKMAQIKRKGIFNRSVVFNEQPKN